MKNLKLTLLTLLLLPLMAMAQQLPLYVITGSGTSFTATKDNAAISTGAIQTVINAIKTNASGASVEIQFGNGTDTLDIGTANITFDGGDTGWNVTLSGKISSSIINSGATIYMINSINVESKADIRKKSSGSVIENSSSFTGTLTISSGTISGTINAGGITHYSGTLTISGGTIQGSDYAIYNYSTGAVNIIGGTISGSIINYSTGTMNINGGTISATASNASAVYNSSTGKITISGNAYITSANTSTTGGTIYIANSETTTEARLEVTGGTITNTATNGNAIYNASTSSISLGGSPTITGNINKSLTAGNLSVITEGEDAFVLNNKVYKLYFDANTPNGVAVVNGKNFLANFTLATDNFKFAPSNNDILIEYVGLSYKYSKSGSLYIITEESGLAPELRNIQNLINDIKTDANGEPCEIQFGNGTNSLVIDAASIIFNGSAPGWDVRLSGKIVSSDTSTNGVIYMTNGANVESKADIRNIYSNGYAIRNSDNGTLTISGGTISAGSYAIYNSSTGTVNISDGTIYATNINANAVYNSSTGTVNMSGGAIYATNGSNAYAVHNRSTGKVNISGGTVSASRYAIYNSSTGTVNMSGGTISATTSNASAVYNSSTGKITISGNAYITSANPRANSGTIYIANSGTATEARLEVTGGTITNTATNGNAIYNASTSSISLGDSPTITGNINKSLTAGNLSVITEGKDAFVPNNKVYKLYFDANTPNGVAVVNGANFLANFALITLITDNLKFEANNNDILIEYIGTGYKYSKSGNTYVITKASAPALRIQNLVNAIKTDANGASVEIQFGNGTDTLDIDTANIAFDGSAPGWNVTLSGKITSSNTSNNGVIYMTNGANVENKADIRNTYSNGYAIRNSDNGTLTISGGTISGGTYDVYSTGSISLSGSPNIEGNIRISVGKLSVVTEGENAFIPENKVYTLSFNAYTPNGVAVINGKNFLANFKLSSDEYDLIINNNDLVFTRFSEPNEPNEPNKFTGFSYTKLMGNTYMITESAIIGEYYSIQETINKIKADANGASVEIQFGNGTDTLNIGDASINFDVPGNLSWGQITLSGKIISSSTSTIHLSNSANVESKADIRNISSNAITNDGTGILTISDGTISAGRYSVYNTSSGTVNISGGTISTTASYAIYNYSIGAGGIVNISGGTIQGSDCAIYNYSTGAVNIIGGTISGNNAIYSNSSVVLGGNPNIIGRIITNFGKLSVTTEGENVFVPENKIYTLLFINSYDIDSLAVLNGKNFLKNFTIGAISWGLIASGNNLVLTTAKSACIANGNTWENNQCTTPTPIRTPQIAASQIRAQSIPNGIMLQNLPQNAKIEAYNLQGKQIYSSTSHSPLATSLIIPVQTKGMYIIKVTLGSQKQILRMPVR